MGAELRVGEGGAVSRRKSRVFAGGKKFEGKWVTGQRVFVAMLDALGMTPACE